MCNVSRCTCAVKKAEVRDPDGRAGLLRASETRSLPVKRCEGAEISKPFGFLPFRGVLLASPLLSGVVLLCNLSLSLWPDDRFRGCALGSNSSASVLWTPTLTSIWVGLCGGEEDEEEEEQASWGDGLEEWEFSVEDGGGVEGSEEWPRWVMNRMTEEQSSGRSDLGSVLIGRCCSKEWCRELILKEEYRPEWRYWFLSPPSSSSASGSDAVPPLSSLLRPDSTNAGSIFRISGNDTNL